MYQVLVVDDEPRHRRGVADMIKVLRPHYRVFLAKDGEEALQIVEANRIDIILTDIRMPKIDGLQLIASLGNRTEDIKVVILSVYNYFDYAKKALTLGAFDYLVKPIEINDMAEMLRKLEATLEKDRKRHRDEKDLKQRLQSTMAVYEEHLLNRWMYANISEGERSEIAGLISNVGMGFVLLTKFDKHEIEQIYTSDEFDEVKDSFRSWVQQTLQSLGQSVSFYLEGPDPVMVSVIAPHEPSEWLVRRNIECLSNLIDHIQAEFGVSVSIGVGRLCGDLFRQIRVSFEQAMNALDFAFYCGQGKLIIHSEISYDPYKPAFKTFPSETSIATDIIQLNRAQALESLDSLFAQLLCGNYPSPTHAKESILYILMNQVRLVETFLRSEEASNLIAEMEFQIPACTNLPELKRKAGHFVFRMIDNIENRKNNRNHMIIQMCKDYLAQHYMEDLSLEVIAKKYFFSPTYFSTFFKINTSMTFTEYVLRLRIEKAKALLVDAEWKVSEIALNVGFRDAGYFTRVFKREVGMSPEDFRKNTAI